MARSIERRIAAASSRADAAATYAAATIDALARAAFARFWRLLQDTPGMDVREAIMAVQVEFGGQFAEALRESFETLLASTIGLDQVRALPVGDVSLSRRLYLHAVQTAAEVTALVRQHTQGVVQARELSLALYDGYSPADGIRRPLEGAARALLPRALRELTADADARRTLTALQVQGQQQAARLKTRALRAAYLEAFEAWEDDAGEKALRKRLQVALREKNRYFADRIAQTELHRAHQAQVAAELMDDVETTVVQVVLSPTHPRVDICDLHARADLWGLGPGRYPKAKAPRPPFHPFCRCKLKSRPSQDAIEGRVAPAPAGAWLRTLSDRDQALVMGSRERADRVLMGEPAESVINEGKAPAHRLVRVGDARAVRHPLLREAEATPAP